MTSGHFHAIIIKHYRNINTTNTTIMAGSRSARQPNDPSLVTDFRRNVGHFVPDNRVGREVASVRSLLVGLTPDFGEVVIKPFSKSGRAKNEARQLIGASEKGLRAVEPLSVCEGGLATYLVTRRIHGLHNLANAGWNIDIASSRLPHVNDLLGRVATVASEMHGAGVTHGDFKPKNTMFDEKGAVFADAERAHVDPSSVVATSLADSDIVGFGRNVMGKGLLYDKSPGYRAGHLAEMLVDPYLASLPTQRYGSPDVRRASIHAGLVEAAHSLQK